jgi:hypothetical protein
MIDHADAPSELMPLEPCDCCGVPVSYRNAGICRPCFYIWYDDGLIKPADIRRVRLKRYGTADTQECL